MVRKFNNMSSIPIVFELKNVTEGPNATYRLLPSTNNSTINLTENNLNNVGSQPILLPISTQFIPNIDACAKQIQTNNIQNNDNFNFEIVYPEDLNLKRETHIKRGRPKKKVVSKVNVEIEKEKDIVNPPIKTARTRSGRVVKLPKYIEKDFEKVEVRDTKELSADDFLRIDDDPKEVQKENVQLELHQRKRMISAQFRCPKCQKAYMGKNKMLEHLKKYPDHGPMPDGFNKLNFEVWNYLVDVTQKCPVSQRGAKFCEELANLLHNAQLLTSALFRTVTNGSQKNLVQVDKVLGNALGLEPGQYSFNDNELYKDVTVLQLITNTEFFKPNNNCHEDKTNSKQQPDLENNLKHEPTKSNKSTNDFKSDPKIDITDTDSYFKSSDDNLIPRDIRNSENSFIKSLNNIDNNFESNDINKYNPLMENSSKTSSHLQNTGNLLSENSLLNSLPNLRNSVDDLMLTAVDTTSNLLDNSTSSDEVMNVDQFVNERFKKITEPDMELTGSSLNLELPSLDLFHFHTN